MNRTLAFVLLAVPFGAFAQGFAPLALSDPGETCYTWEGGHKSAGSFSKCNPTTYVRPKVVAALPPPPAPSPIMMPMQSCPLVAMPHKRPIVKKKRPALKC